MKGTMLSRRDALKLCTHLVASTVLVPPRAAAPAPRAVDAQLEVQARYSILPGA